jgi:hypothetical protein
MFRDRHGNVLECIMPGCGRPVSERQLAAGHALCSARCRDDFKAKHGRTELNLVEDYLRSITCGKRDAPTCCSSAGSPLFVPVTKQAGVRHNIMAEAFDQADSADGWTAFERVARVLAGGNIPADAPLDGFNRHGRTKWNPRVPPEARREQPRPPAKRREIPLRSLMPYFTGEQQEAIRETLRKEGVSLDDAKIERKVCVTPTPQTV